MYFISKQNKVHFQIALFEKGMMQHVERRLNVAAFFSCFFIKFY